MSIPRRARLAAILAAGAALAAVVYPQAQAAPAGTKLVEIGRLGGLGAEIVAYDGIRKRAWVTDAATAAVSIVDLADPAAPALIRTVSLTAYGQTVTSVAIFDQLVAVGTRPDTAAGAGARGTIVLLDLDGNFRNTATAGFGPDAVSFTKDGSYVLVANEGEPRSYGQPDSVDPEGSVSIIRIQAQKLGEVREVGFGGLSAADLPGVRISGPNASVAQDIEPEYIASTADEKTAYVTLQENNAVAEIDIASATVRAVRAAGYADHSAVAVDASDRELPDSPDDANTTREPAILLKTRPALLGMRMPDAIAVFKHAGKTYYVTANEGDGREYTGWVDDRRVSAVPPGDLPSAWGADAANLRLEQELGRLTVTRAAPWVPGGPLYAYGSRSVSVFDASGNLVSDTGDAFEQVTKGRVPGLFNSELGNSALWDTRSDNKGPEPEGVTVADVNGRRLAAITLERTGGVMLYDLSDPAAPRFLDYVAGDAANAGPEGVVIVPQGPNGRPLVLTASEIGNALTIYEIRKD